MIDLDSTDIYSTVYVSLFTRSLKHINILIKTDNSTRYQKIKTEWYNLNFKTKSDNSTRNQRIKTEKYNISFFL